MPAFHEVMRRITVDLDDGEYRALKIVSAETDRSMSDMVRQAISRHLRHPHDASDNDQPGGVEPPGQ